jgi:hypothetical protein
MTISILTLNIKGLYVTLIMTVLCVMLSVIMLNVTIFCWMTLNDVEFRYAEFRYAEFRYARCHGAVTIPKTLSWYSQNTLHNSWVHFHEKWSCVLNYFRSFKFPILWRHVIILNEVIPNVIFLNVIIPSRTLNQRNIPENVLIPK